MRFATCDVDVERLDSLLFAHVRAGSGILRGGIDSLGKLCARSAGTRRRVGKSAVATPTRLPYPRRKDSGKRSGGDGRFGKAAIGRARRLLGMLPACLAGGRKLGLDPVQITVQMTNTVPRGLCIEGLLAACIGKASIV
jgi:hypothetical protein